VVRRWFVSRQDYWGEESPLAVEIAAGGLDHANADMLGVAYESLGEGREYDDPREAADAAIAIAEAWRRDSGRPDEITVRVGYTGGMSIPFDEGTDEDARAWAERARAALPTCPALRRAHGQRAMDAGRVRRGRRRGLLLRVVL
jgi:hypothetical protein